MANIKEFKMDVKQMVKQFLQECYTHLAYSPPLHQENVLDIISDAMELEKEMIRKINELPAKREQLPKNYFRSLSNDFYDRIVEFTERLNSLEY